MNQEELNQLYILLDKAKKCLPSCSEFKVVSNDGILTLSGESVEAYTASWARYEYKNGEAIQVSSGFCN